MSNLHPADKKAIDSFSFYCNKFEKFGKYIEEQYNKYKYLNYEYDKFVLEDGAYEGNCSIILSYRDFDLRRDDSKYFMFPLEWILIEEENIWKEKLNGVIKNAK